jgi:hypothetical protein
LQIQLRDIRQQRIGLIYHAPALLIQSLLLGLQLRHRTVEVLRQIGSRAQNVLPRSYV